MGQHDAYGKQLLRMVAGTACNLAPPPHHIGGLNIRVDAVIGGDVAVEIESRTPKQIRGAVMDLLLHPAPRKLLLLLPVHHHSTEAIGSHCSTIMGRFLADDTFEVIELSGTGDIPDPSEDVPRIREALRRLGSSWSQATPT